MPNGDRSDETAAMTPFRGAESASVSAERVVLAGRYEILGLIGSGGMGSVYRAFDRELEEIVALKTLREGTAATPRALERFRREVRLARRVTHPNVARMFDIGEHGSERFITMEYVDGEALSSLLTRTGRLPPGRAAQILSALCAGLEAAHAVGVVHRDLKPENVLLEGSGRVVITDFGIACAREDPTDRSKTLGGVVGTPAYMAPEQVEAAPDIDARADLYALGVMLFEMLTGLLPFRGNSAYAVAAARLTEPPPDPRSLSPELPEAFSKIVMRCLARQREDRFSRAAEVAAALDPLSPTLTEEESAAMSFPRSARPRPMTENRLRDKTLAVLPFRNAGPDEDQYVADGLTEDLIDTLSMVEGLKLRPRASVLAHLHSTDDPREVGRLLDVEVVVDGTLRRLGDSLRVTARLISVSDGFQLWAKRFDRSPADVLVVSDEAAHAIAEALTAGSAQPPRQAPSDASAIDLYLKGRSELGRVWREPTRRAVELFGEAERRAPTDATILAAHARARARLWYFDGGAEGRTARTLAERALARAPERGESWLALASVRLMEQDLEAAARLLVQSLARAPHLGEAHQLLGEVLLEVGDLDQAVDSLRTALALDPELRVELLLARASGYRGQWSEVDATLGKPASDEHARVAHAAARARMALWSDHARQRIEAVELPESAEDAAPVHYVRWCVDTIRSGTLSPQARAFMQAQLDQADPAPRFAVFKHQLACELHAYVGEPDAALAHLRAAVLAGLADRNWLEHCPLLSGVADRATLAGLAETVRARAERVRAAL